MMLSSSKIQCTLVFDMKPERNVQGSTKTFCGIDSESLADTLWALFPPCCPSYQNCSWCSACFLAYSLTLKRMKWLQISFLSVSPLLLDFNWAKVRQIHFNYCLYTQLIWGNVPSGRFFLQVWSSAVYGGYLQHSIHPLEQKALLISWSNRYLLFSCARTMSH